MFGRKSPLRWLVIFPVAVFEWGAIWLADYAEELVDGVVCVDGYDFAAEVFEFNGGFWYEVFEVYAQNDSTNKDRQETNLINLPRD